MRESLISILTVLAIVAPLTKCSDHGKDGFNFYKDYLRGRNDEVDDMVEAAASEDRMLYFYRTPLHVPSLIPVLEQEHRKRTGNAFKNHMLNKDLWADGVIPGKRGSKTALSLMMKQPYYGIGSSGGDNMEIPL